MESSQVNKENEKNLKRAKEIFRFCRGSGFHMWREELLEEFESYGVTEEMKRRWLREMIDEDIYFLQKEKEESKIIDYLISLDLIVEDFKDEIGYSVLVKYIKDNIDRFDSENKIICAETLLNLLKRLNQSYKEKQSVYKLAMQILKDVCEQPITYADYRYFNGKIHPNLSEQSLKKRARQGIKEGREYWGESPVKIAVESMTTGIKMFLSALKRKRKRVTIIENNLVNKENEKNLSNNNEKNLSRAKEIFKTYNGDRYGMWKDNVLEEFESYELSETTRTRWAYDLRDEYIDKLNKETNELRSVQLLMDLKSLVLNYRDEISYSTLVRYIKENINHFDSKNRIVVAGILLSAMRSLGIAYLNQEILEFGLQVLEDVCEQPITYADYRYVNGKIDPELSEQAIKENARKEIKNWKKFWKL